MLAFPVTHKTIIHATHILHIVLVVPENNPLAYGGKYSTVYGKEIKLVIRVTEVNQEINKTDYKFHF